MYYHARLSIESGRWQKLASCHDENHHLLYWVINFYIFLIFLRNNMHQNANSDVSFTEVCGLVTVLLLFIIFILDFLPHPPGSCALAVIIC